MNNLDQIDKELAEKVMGWYQSEDCYLDDYYVTKSGSNDPTYQEVPQHKAVTWHPTRSIAQAFQVVERMRELGIKGFELRQGYVSGTWEGLFPIADNPGGWLVGPATKDPAEAISRAALKAYDSNQPKPEESAESSGPPSGTQ